MGGWRISIDSDRLHGVLWGKRSLKTRFLDDLHCVAHFAKSAVGTLISTSERSIDVQQVL